MKARQTKKAKEKEKEFDAFKSTTLDFTKGGKKQTKVHF